MSKPTTTPDRYNIKLPIHRHKVESIRTPEQRDDFIRFLSGLVDTMPRGIPNMPASDWIEEHIVIVEGDYQGPYSFRLTPYLQEIADRMSIRSLTQEIAIIKANQLGMSMLSFALIAYYIYYGVGPQIFVSGDQTMAEETFEKRLDPLLEASGLRHLIKPIVKKSGGARATGDTKGVKAYKGTHIRAVGPNSEGQLRSMPARIAIVEEIDVYPQTLKGKGNPVEKIVRRTDNYGVNRRIYYNSTPKEKATSQILPLFEAGTKSLYTWVCPKCGHRQPFVWAGMDWDKNEDGSPRVDMDDDGRVTHDPTYYRCQNPQCDHTIREHEKFKLLLTRKQGGTAEYVPQKKPDRPGLWSCQVNALYSPTRSWLDIVLQYWRVKDDPILYPDFVNDSLAECSDVTVKTPEPHVLARRAESWTQEDARIPQGVIFTTHATDVQGNRIESALVGWGKNDEAWLLKYWTFDGDPADPDDDCWKRWAQTITDEAIREDGVNIGAPKIVFVDAGFSTDAVMTICSMYPPRRNSPNGVYPVFGRDQQIVGRTYKKIQSQIANPTILINDQRFKKMVYASLSRDRPSPDAPFPRYYIHFPADLHPDFYKQLVAEEMIEVVGKGGRVSHLIQNTHQRRNEPLDIMKMNYAARFYLCSEYYEAINKNRRANKKTEIAVDWVKFFEIMESYNE